MRYHTNHGFRRYVWTGLCGATVFAGMNCSTRDVQRVVAGIDAVVNHEDPSSPDLGDWISDEWDDLWDDL